MKKLLKSEICGSMVHGRLSQMLRLNKKKKKKKGKTQKKNTPQLSVLSKRARRIVRSK